MRCCELWGYARSQEQESRGSWTVLPSTARGQDPKWLLPESSNEAILLLRLPCFRWSPPYLFRTHLVVSLISIGILTVALYKSKKWPIHSLVGLVLPSTWFGQGCVTLQLGHCERDVLAWGISGRRLTNLGSNMFPICSNQDQIKWDKMSLAMFRQSQLLKLKTWHCQV